MKNVRKKRVHLGDAQQADVLHALKETYPEVKTSNWRGAVRTAFAALEDVSEMSEDFADLVEGLRFVPDGYAIIQEPPELHFFEVEVHNPMNTQKLQAYGKFAIELAFYGINFSLFVVNKHGHINQEDVMFHYAEWLQGWE